MGKYRVWECKLVIPIDSKTPEGFDSPPRRAAIEAVERSGFEVLSMFSGWGGELTTYEESLVDHKNNPLPNVSSGD